MTERKVLVVGIGNELRGDDGAGIQVARRLRERPASAGIEVREHQGEPLALLGAWAARDAVVLIDTMRSGARPGAIRRLDATSGPLPARGAEFSTTHAFALDQAIELGRSLGSLPKRVIVFAVEGRSFEAGDPLSPELEAIVPALTESAWREAVALASG